MLEQLSAEVTRLWQRLWRAIGWSLMSLIYLILFIAWPLLALIVIGLVLSEPPTSSGVLVLLIMLLGCGLYLGSGAGWLVGRHQLARSVAQRLRSMAPPPPLNVHVVDRVGASGEVGARAEVGPEEVVTLPAAEFRAMVDELDELVELEH